MFKNNVFTNPIGWSNKIVGTVSKYIISVVSTIFLGIVLMFIFTTLYKITPIGLKHYYFIMLLIAISTIIFPLFYLKAMRSLLVELKNYSKYNKERI